jgi:hypothetical protein
MFLKLRGFSPQANYTDPTSRKTQCVFIAKTCWLMLLLKTITIQRMRSLLMLVHMVTIVPQGRAN